MKAKTVPFTAFTTAILKLYTPPLTAIATFRKTRQVLEEFSRICPATTDLTAQAVAGWVTDHPLRRRSTVRTLLSSLRAAVNAAGPEHQLANPFLTRRLHKYLPRALHQPTIRRHHSAAEIARVLLIADQEAPASWKARRRQCLLYLAAFTGARAREILGALVEDLDLVEGVIHIRPNERRPLKTDASNRDIPLPGPALSIARQWLTRSDRSSRWLLPHQGLHGPWFHGATRNKPLNEIKALGKRAGLEGLTLLSLRHSFATAADHRQIGPKALQDLLGHSSPQTQWPYRHTDPAELRRAADRVRFP
jgi:integrase